MTEKLTPTPIPPPEQPLPPFELTRLDLSTVVYDRAETRVIIKRIKAKYVGRKLSTTSRLAEGYLKTKRGTDSFLAFFHIDKEDPPPTDGSDPLLFVHLHVNPNRERSRTEKGPPSGATAEWFLRELHELVSVDDDLVFVDYEGLTTAEIHPRYRPIAPPLPRGFEGLKLAGAEYSRDYDGSPGMLEFKWGRPEGGAKGIAIRLSNCEKWKIDPVDFWASEERRCRDLFRFVV